GSRGGLQVRADGGMGRGAGGGAPRGEEHRTIRNARGQIGGRAQPVELRSRRAVDPSASRRKGAGSLDTDGISLYRRIRNPTKTIDRPRAHVGGWDFRPRKRDLRGDVPGHGLSTSPPEFERPCRVVRTL